MSHQNGASFNRYLSLIALFERSTSFGEARAVRDAILRLEEKHGFSPDDLGGYFTAAFGDSVRTISGADFGAIGFCVQTATSTSNPDIRWSHYARLVYLASVALLTEQPYIIGRQAHRANPLLWDANPELFDMLDSVQDTVFFLDHREEEEAA